MSRTLPNVPSNVYRERSKYVDLYEPVDAVPDGLKWKPSPGYPGVNVTVLLSTPGSFYKLIRDRKTGDVVYFKLKDTGAEKSPANTIDTEPTKPKQIRYRVGAQCWFIDTGNRWYLCEVVERTGEDRATAGSPKTITIKSVTGWDADRQAPWGYGELLQFPAGPGNPLFQRLRPLKARYR